MAIAARRVVSPDASQRHWYNTECNTASLIQAVVRNRKEPWSGRDIWNLLRLTWITNGSEHWKVLKVPALADLFRGTIQTTSDLQGSLDQLRLPPSVRRAANHGSGFVNFRTVWRNSALPWCEQNRELLSEIIAAVRGLGVNDQERIAVALTIRSLPRIPSPNDKALADPGNLLSPLIACLDPKMRFPVVNGREGVTKLLRKLHLAYSTLDDQVKGLIGIIGQFGISDALMLDVLAEDLKEITIGETIVPSEAVVGPGSTSLPTYDEAERTAVLKSRTVMYRARHDRMTNALRSVLPKTKLEAGNHQDCRYDAMALGYDGDRDLLIEAKPDHEKGDVRIAVGQLLDYRRFLPGRTGTDMAFLTITKPSQSYMNFLLDLQITVLWYEDERCLRLRGEGKAWQAIERLM